MIVAHFADSHLAPSGSKLDPESGLNARLIDRYTCTRFVIEDAVSRGANLIVCCGDLYNSPKPTPTDRRLAIEALAPGLAAGIPIILLLGNHEASRSPLEKHALDTMREVEGVTVIDRPCLLNVWEHDPTQPYTIEALDMSPPDAADLALQLACLPWPNAGLLLRDEDVRKLGPGERNLLVRQAMMDCARGLAAQRIEGVPCLLLGHFSLDVAAAGAQDRLMMLGGEWTLNLHELGALGFDAALLGHIHRGQSFDPLPVWYSGSPEACSFGEEGEIKSYVMVEVGPAGDITQEIIPTPYRRLHTLTGDDFDVDVEDGSVFYAAEDPIAAGIVRLEIPAGSALTVEEARRALEAAGAFEARVTKGRVETQRRRESAVSSEMSAAEALRAWLETKPDLHPIADALVTEAIRVEEALGGGAQ